MGGRASLRSAFLAAAIVVTAASARAQDTNRVAAATLLFDEGVRALDAGRLDEACQKLAKSQELAPSGGTLLALGECHERAGRVASAWVAFRGAAARAAAAGKSDAEASALEHAAKLEPMLARLTLKLAPGASPNVDLQRDNGIVTTSELGVAVPIDPGHHEIRASATGSKPWTKVIEIAPGAAVTLEIPPLEPARAPDRAVEPPPPVEDHSGRTQRILGITAAGVGVGGLIGGTIFGLLAKSANDDGESICHGQRACDPKGIDLIDTASDRALVSTIFFVAGAALVAGGAALYFTAPSPRKGAYLDLSSGAFRW